MLPLLPIPRTRAQPSTGCSASRSWMHSLLVIRPRSVAADSFFLSCAAPFSPCLPMAPADAAADEQTRRARQHSRPALPSPGRHRHGSFRSRLFGSKSSPGYQQRVSGQLPALAPTGCVTWAVGFRMPEQPGLGCWAPSAEPWDAAAPTSTGLSAWGLAGLGADLAATANPPPQHWAQWEPSDILLCAEHLSALGKWGLHAWEDPQDP